MNTILSFGLALTAPLLRCVGGWLENAIRDGKITEFEWRQLATTSVRLIVITAGTFFGITMLTGQADIVSSAFTAILFDFIINKLGKTK